MIRTQSIVNIKKNNNNHNLKNRCFIQWEFLGLQTQEIATQVTLKESFDEVRGGAKLYRNPTNNKGQVARTSTRLLLKPNISS